MCTEKVFVNRTHAHLLTARNLCACSVVEYDPFEYLLTCYKWNAFVLYGDDTCTICVCQVERWNEQRENGTFPGPL